MELPQYKEFLNKIDEIEHSDYSYVRRHNMKRRAERKYNIFITPITCDENCPYKKMCEKENAKPCFHEDNITFTRYERKV